MSFLITNAFADGAAAVAAGPRTEGSFSLIMVIGIFVLFYFMMIRPQNKRAKQHKELVSALKKGDEIVLSSGILAKVDNLVNDVYLKATVNSGVDILVQRDSVTAVLPKGTLDSL
ncbi:MAG: preprotein translocase subunit YajC [Gammaproteobacteria bacterium]|nr:preprotein translocase subunit YajC [Gammaproteobacteria bacterium]